MIQWLRMKYVYLHSTFHDSSNILWARFNVLLGAAFAAAQATDLSPLFSNPKYLTFWLIFSNLVGEYTRRRGATYDIAGNLK